MGRIETTFQRLKTQDKKALITYIMAGDPDLSATKALISTIEQAGGDILELGVPFSDPVADGPAIQRASERALQSKTTLRKVLALVKKARKDGAAIPVIIIPTTISSFSTGLIDLQRMPPPQGLMERSSLTSPLKRQRISLNTQGPQGLIPSFSWPRPVPGRGSRGSHHPQQGLSIMSR